MLLRCHGPRPMVHALRGPDGGQAGILIERTYAITKRPPAADFDRFESQLPLSPPDFLANLADLDFSSRAVGSTFLFTSDLLTLPGLQRIRGRAGQAPGEA